MAKKEGNNLKLGAFVLAGLLVLIVSFYMIGRNENFFGTDFELKSRFNNLNGLMEGNNVLFSGLQAGTVKKIEMLNDTTIEVTMQLNQKLTPFIQKNALTSIGSEGLMGNKVVNILPVKEPGKAVVPGDLLTAINLVSTDEMLQTLSKTNNNIAGISEALRNAVLRLDSSAIFEVLNDKTIGTSLRSSLTNINLASENANGLTQGLATLVNQVRNGEGAAGMLLSDAGFSEDLRQTGKKLRSASTQADILLTTVNHDLADGKGPLHAFFRDTVIVPKLSLTLDHTAKAADGFAQVMEAIKHNFLFRGYFKKVEKERAGKADQ